MSDFRIFVGDQEMPLDATSMELQMDSGGFDLSPRPFVQYGLSQRSASATFELTDPAWEMVRQWAVNDRRVVTLTNEYPLEWSRWRRWLNAILRVAWWPLGPPALPVSTEATVTFPEMTIDRIAGGRGTPLYVEMSTRSKS